MHKREIVRILREIAFFLRLRGENPYKARAYEQAGAALLACPEEPATLVSEGRLKQLRGIGPATAAVITDLVQMGASSVHGEARGSYPSSLAELEHVPGLTIKQIQRLFEKGGIRSMAELEAVCRKTDGRDIPGLGPKQHAKLMAALGEYRRGQGYVLYADAAEEARHLAQGLAEIAEVSTVTLAGGLRRKMEVVQELVFVVGCDPPSTPASLAQAVAVIPNVTDVATRSGAVSARSPQGWPVAIIPAARQDHGYVLLQATGHEEHLALLWKRFSDRGFSEWGDVRASLAGAGEEQIYQAAGLPWIPPELREGRGEIQWAEEVGRPPLIEAAHIQGFFHTHTQYSDGAGTVEEMVRAARGAGYRYLGISDHSQSAQYANGLKEPRIRAQWAEIATVQKKYRDIHIFRGIEADILPDGTMDYPDALLAEFDFVIASVHSRFNLAEEDQTRRICRALANPHVTMLGHPTGRLLLSRAGYRVDLARVIAAAAAHRKLIEINGSRYRLDLDWRWVQSAKLQGVQFCINPDAHAMDEVANVGLGVNVARKAGLSPADVFNTRSADNLKRMLPLGRRAA